MLARFLSRFRRWMDEGRRRDAAVGEPGRDDPRVW